MMIIQKNNMKTHHHDDNSGKEAHGGQLVRQVVVVLARVDKAAHRLLKDFNEGDVRHDAGAKAQQGSQNSSAGQLDYRREEDDGGAKRGAGASAADQRQGDANVFRIGRRHDPMTKPVRGR